MQEVMIERMCTLIFFFFFQAEDGIRDLTVTGVQTCALPISGRLDPTDRHRRESEPRGRHQSSTRIPRGDRREQRKDSDCHGPQRDRREAETRRGRPSSGGAQGAGGITAGYRPLAGRGRPEPESTAPDEETP